MADEYIEKEAAKKKHCEICLEERICYRGKQNCAELKAFDLIPAADVQPVVRCKDCKYCLKADEFEYWCNGFCFPARLVNKEDFCSHGKARD